MDHYKQFLSFQATISAKAVPTIIAGTYVQSMTERERNRGFLSCIMAIWAIIVPFTVTAIYFWCNAAFR